jgi:hypothetical protein
MRRVAAWLGLLAGLSGCGLVFDGAYLLSSKRYTSEEIERQRTSASQVVFEHEVRAERGQVWLACEDVERTIERTWTVQRTWEYQGGFYRAHLLPLIVEGIVATAMTAAFGYQCSQGRDPARCTELWWTVPLWSDALYSGIRLLTIDPPKLVDKTRSEGASEPSATPTARRTVACEPDARLVVSTRGPLDPLPAIFRVDAWGAMDPMDRPRLLQALRQGNAELSWAAGGNQPTSAKLSRCEALAALGEPCASPRP